MTTSPTDTPRCIWCLKRNLPKHPQWEQQNLDGTWQPMCQTCAKKRLDNPYNALLGMRKISQDVQP